MSTTPHLSPFLREALAVLETTPARRLAARMAGADQPDVLQSVAMAMLDRDRSGKEPPTNVAAYVMVAIRHECLSMIEATRAARRTPRQDPAMSAACPSLFPASAFGEEEGELIASAEPVEPIDSVDDMVEQAMSRISPERVAELRKTYWYEIPIRSSRRGAPAGTAVSRAKRGRDDLRRDPTVAEAAAILDIGVRDFEPAPHTAEAWRRYVDRNSSDADGLRTLDMIRAWASLAGRSMDAGSAPDRALASTRAAAIKIAGANGQIAAAAERAIRRMWVRAAVAEAA